LVSFVICTSLDELGPAAAWPTGVMGVDAENPDWPEVLVQPDVQRSYACSPNFTPPAKRN